MPNDYGKLTAPGTEDSNLRFETKPNRPPSHLRPPLKITLPPQPPKPDDKTGKDKERK